MSNHTWIRALVAVNILVAGAPLMAHAQVKCADILEQKRGFAEPVVDWRDDKSYLEASQHSEAFGQVATFFSNKWDTQVFYTNTGTPDAKGTVPLVDPEAKAVVIFFHGSGTKKSSGKNFVHNMNTLANLGYASVSVDMPHHANGPTDPKFDNAFYFMEWVRQIVLEVKKSGKPVYIAGHSFGPDVILEFATRYPKTIDGVLALSPAGFTKVLSKWYDKYTSKMVFGGDVAENEAGGTWAANVSSQFLWTKSKLKDPTIVNPNLKIRILSGNREEYVPAPLGGPGNTPTGENYYNVKPVLQRLFKNATVTIEPGIGHYLFDFVDVNGQNTVLRELMTLLGEDPSKLKGLYESVVKQRQTIHTSGQLARRYSQDSIFKAWADLNYGKGTALKAAAQNQDGLAQKMMGEYFLAIKKRDAEIQQKIVATKETNPEFYSKYKTQIDKLSLGKGDNSLFLPYAAEVLSKNVQ
jgi:acetyl esterase/lipase